MRKETLFREEAIKFRQTKLTGDIVLYQPLSIRTLTKLMAFIMLLILIFLSTVNVDRIESVRGYLEPSEGLIQVYGESNGILKELYVEDGQFIEAGQKIALITNHLTHLNNGVSEINSHIKETKFQLLQNSKLIENTRAILNVEKSAGYKELDIYQKILKHLKIENKLFIERSALAQEQIDNLEILLEGGNISNAYYREHKSKNLEVIQEQLDIEKQTLTTQKSVDELEGRLTLLDMELTEKISSIDSSSSNLRRQLSSLNRKQEYILTASVSGYITNIQFKRGENIKTDKSLLTILPENSHILVKLLIPSNAIGFLKTNQEAKIFYDSFPYQRFGYHEGVVDSISSAAYSESSLNLPIKSNGLNYIATVKLEKQSMNAFGAEMKLTPGMLVSADIILEKDTLLNWALEPIYSMSGRL